MSKHTQSKQNSTISISAGLLILILLANVLSSCVTVIQTQVPIVPISEFTPTVQNLPTQELTLVSPTEVATEMPTLTPKPTATETPTPTKEKSLIEGNIFFDPQSKEDFKDVALSPSPFDEPEKFALWHEEYFKQINEKLENYNGPTVELTKSLSNAKYGLLEYSSEKWPVVGSYLFKWRGEDVLNKTYIFSKKSDGDGYVLLNTTYYPESIVNSHKLLYKYDYTYGTPKEGIAIRYCLNDYMKESWPEAFNTDFFNTYVVTQDKIDSIFRIFFHKPEEGDEAVFSQMQFIAARAD